MNEDINVLATGSQPEVKRTEMKQPEMGISAIGMTGSNSMPTISDWA